MRIGDWCLLVALVAALAALPTVAFAGGDNDEEKQYDIEGTWYGINSFGNYVVYTVVRVGPDEYTSDFDFLGSPNPFGFGSTMKTGYVMRIRRTHKNSYDLTAVAYYGDNNNSMPYYFGVTYAAVTSGTVEQAGPDTLVAKYHGKISCNPCWPGAAVVCHTTTACPLPQQWEPWDPFNDPDTICGGSEYVTVARRMPIDRPCTPP
ncbi:MAG: hypothetical protein MUF27_14210 [Acidobacteria bacterium]|jgi:hypothetical protein|nr:hypothetical protein [Acidobacteriota bacterium]